MNTKFSCAVPLCRLLAPLQSHSPEEFADIGYHSDQVNHGTWTILNEISISLNFLASPNLFVSWEFSDFSVNFRCISEFWASRAGRATVGASSIRHEFPSYWVVQQTRWSADRSTSQIRRRRCIGTGEGEWGHLYFTGLNWLITALNLFGWKTIIRSKERGLLW